LKLLTGGQHDYFPMLTELKTFSALLCVSLHLLTQLAADPSRGSATLAEQTALGAEAAPLLLTVDGMIERLRQQSPRVLFERESVRRALEQSFQQRAGLLPQIALRASQARQQFGRGFAGDAFEAPPFNSFGARLEGSLSLFDTQRYADYRLALLEHAIAETNYQVALQDILDQAVQLYFTQLRDLRRVEIVAGNIERNAALLDLARQQLVAGSAVPIDVTRAEVRLATQQRAMMSAQAAVKTSSLQLKALLDVDLDRSLHLDRSIIHDIKAPPSLKRYAPTGRSWMEQRPELASQQKQLAQAQLARRAAAWQRLPSVELFGNWGYDSNEALDRRHAEAWLVGVRASMPLFEGLRIAAKKREAAAALRQQEHQMRALQTRIEREFRVAMIEMDARYAEIAIAREEIRLGHDEVEQAELRYREGLADNRELIDAQQRLADAENSHLRSAYLYGLSRLAFARAIGAVERVLD
jgi:outer membrane protein TolC